MEEELKEMRIQLEKIESAYNGEQLKFARDNFNTFDLPKIISSVVDYLQPLLLPYEAVIYWYLFKKSILDTGKNEIRFNSADLCKPKLVIKSSSGNSEFQGIIAVQNAIDGLIEKGVIVNSLHGTKEGHKYLIMIPDKIGICIARKKEIEEEIKAGK